jgi:threonine synthase
VATLSNAMDVGNPSNWVRIADLFKEDMAKLKELVVGFKYNDEETVKAINWVFDTYGYVVCPHTAIAWQALTDYQHDHSSADTAGVFLSTAHPCKFPDVFSEEITAKIEIPEEVKALQSKTKLSVPLSKDFDTFKDYLLNAE